MKPPCTTHALFILFVASWVFTPAVRAGNFTDSCLDNTALSWYIGSIGETPCRTYERLRQSCSPDYQVGPFATQTPGDSCDDQLSACCCNSVSWALSMLCMNCQFDNAGAPNGIDAGAGAYSMYLGKCGKSTNQSMPQQIQTAVCNQDIKIPSAFYNLFWSDGAWFYEYTKQAAQLDITSGANKTRCDVTTTSSQPSSTLAPPSSTSQTLTSTSPPPTSTQSHPSDNMAAIVGGAVGGVAIIVIAIIGAFLCRRKRRRRFVKEDVDLIEEEEGYLAVATPWVPPTGSDTASSASTNLRANPVLGSGRNIETASWGASSASVTLSQSSTSPINSGRPTKSGRNGSQPTVTMHLPADEYHIDAGVSLGRSASGRLPPAYVPRPNEET